MPAMVSSPTRKLRSKYVLFIFGLSLIGVIITFVITASSNDDYSHIRDYIANDTPQLSEDWQGKSIRQPGESRRIHSNDAISNGESILYDVGSCRECGDPISQLEHPNMTKREELNLAIRNLPGYIENIQRETLGESSNENKTRLLARSCYSFGSRAQFGPLHRQLVPDDILHNLECRRHLPRAFIIGVKKGGTNTLFQFLDLHPAIVRSPWEIAWTRALALEGRSRRTYQCFKSMAYLTQGQINLANYPGFLITQQEVFIKMAKRRFPHVKILVILRDPVKRAISDYTHFLSQHNAMVQRRIKDCNVSSTFSDAVVDARTGNVNAKCGFVYRGHYALYLTPLYSIFHPRQILVLDGERFTQQPTEILQTVEKFLGVPPFFEGSSFVFDVEKRFFCANISSRPDFKCMSAAKGRVHPMIDQDMIDKLEEHYHPYNIQLATLLRTKGYEPFPWLFK